MILSILICTIPKRKDMFDSLMEELLRQIAKQEQPALIEVLFDDRDGTPIGEKRNSLLRSATGEYVCFADDDDAVSPDYVNLIMQSLELNPDCCSLRGLITTDGADAKYFIHSVEHTKYFEENNTYYRPPNHLNVIRRSIAIQFEFPTINHGEDTDWAMQICRSGLIKTEAWIDPTLYYYKFISVK